MKVTPTKRKFGKYNPGDTFELKDKVARVLIKVGKLREADEPEEAPKGYQTRMMQAAPSPAPAPAAVLETKQEPEVPQAEPAAETQAEEAPYGYKADGTPRKRPGRAAKTD